MVSRLGFVLLGVLLAAACKGGGKKHSPADAAVEKKKKPAGEVAGDAEGVWIYAPVSRSKEDPPPRYAAELPASLEGMKRLSEGDTFLPPRGHVEDHLCGLDEAMLTRLDTALAATPEAERTEVISRWADLIQYCGAGPDRLRFCAGARPLVTGPVRPSRLVLLLPFARSCSTADDVELYQRGDTPSQAVIAYYWEGGGRGTPPTPRLHAAVQDRIDDDPRVTVLALAATGDKKAIAEAIALCEKTGQRDCGDLAKRRDRDDDDDAPPAAANDLRGRLEAAGRLLAFDAETGQFPNEHDHPARELARLCGPALDGVLFAEQPPRDADDPGDYRIDAWVAGERLSTPAENLGDWYDVDAVVGLVNEALRTARSDCRLFVLPAEGQVAVVAAGPAAELVEAIRAGELVARPK